MASAELDWRSSQVLHPRPMFSPPLPNGLWLIKWIDRVQSLSNARAPRVNVALQRLDLENAAQAQRLSPESVSEVLGGSAKTLVEWHRREIFAGQALTQLRKGDLIQGSRRVGHLPQRVVNLRISNADITEALAVGQEREAPLGWTARYATLNRFDYQLAGSIPGVLEHSKCVLIRQGEAEFVLPATVILQTFYCFERRLANAMLGDHWSRSASEVISFDRYKSGIHTGKHPETGDWYIVMRTGFTKEHASPLAHLWFDPLARARANAIRTEAMRGGHGNPAAGKGVPWFVSAQMPFDLTGRSMDVQFRCLPLRTWRSRNSVAQRYLITSINGYSWPLPDQKIFWELHNSAERSKNPQPEPTQPPFGGGAAPPRPPKEAGDDKATTSEEEPDSSGGDYFVQAVPIVMLSQSHLERQQKASHKEYKKKEPRGLKRKKDTISGGTGANRPNAPGQLQADSLEKAFGGEFELLLQSLDRLQDRGVVSNHVIWSPTEEEFREMRRHIPCWHFLRDDQAALGVQRHNGWATIRTQSPADGRHVSRRMPRAMLAVRVVVKGTPLVLLEVEQSTIKDTYRMFCLEVTRFDDEDMLLMIRRLAAVSGRPKATNIDQVFEPLQPRVIRAWKHAYERDSQHRLVRLDDDWLADALNNAAQS